ncbi:peptide-methionine (S)-S-oxide reductase MsrA [Alkalibaculum sp. M08DMB]|uniref:Peptide methionine sulfoxide reductase MsrA n=1 Tax=Alkalibaculum sporogenes TaxID=2655001 RepID=A0A6A7KBL7_9FIRM|nr:peptide-methionine (S)-S-oxide reductase MsrA [Alkalibaculum sporogenes]MPW26908.1 peptide-methionine (S)-S-oxide reductase MsrA [Alkalibaculum sporogenes]
MKSIILAGGCFWGVQAYFQKIKGVIKTQVGYANGTTINPTYEDVCSGTTNYAEAIILEYDENTISLNDILKKFWTIIDPTTLNQQGNDRGTQYRTGIYYVDDEDLDIIINSKNSHQQTLDKSIVTEIVPLEKFFEAEEYHQNYLQKNPNGYCHINLDEA